MFKEKGEKKESKKKLKKQRTLCNIDVHQSIYIWTTELTTGIKVVNYYRREMGVACLTVLPAALGTFSVLSEW